MESELVDLIYLFPWLMLRGRGPFRSPSLQTLHLVHRGKTKYFLALYGKNLSSPSYIDVERRQHRFTALLLQTLQLVHRATELFSAGTRFVADFALLFFAVSISMNNQENDVIVESDTPTKHRARLGR